MTNLIIGDLKKIYQAEKVMRDKVLDAVLEFSGQISLVCAIGVLEVVKHELLSQYK